MSCKYPVGTHIPWPKIGDRSKASRYMHRRPQILSQESPAVLGGRVKMHGSNLSVALFPPSWPGNDTGKILMQCQSRKRVLTKDTADCFGFRAYITSTYLPEELLALFGEQSMRDTCALDAIEEGSAVVIYGEWVGRGIQKSVGLAQLKHRYWIPFGVAELRDDTTLWGLDCSYGPTSRSRDGGVIPLSTIPDTVFGILIPGRVRSITPDYFRWLKSMVERFQATMLKVEECCPVATFLAELEGTTLTDTTGEGVVYMPSTTDPHTWFKVKGDKHHGPYGAKVGRQGPDTQGAERAETFVHKHVTPCISSCLGQVMAGDSDIPLDREHTGHFIGMVWADFVEETKHLWEEADVSKRKMNPVLAARARAAWFYFLETQA